ncbi:hypothetical protein SS50377_26696 [Spironucleus salmonicida]|uniref:Uncharacterized protein n=1 Tax=Spironucleus salmonicida TaxID=348837 RepID=V6LXA1_9EUKA|nr:hypothetical protein SS50377_26696 [Spironucleus salmonicida]|eukprot:EST49170.1 Hypothetical protein SS50377_10383 [Spironucleus salmonicida]
MEITVILNDGGQQFIIGVSQEATVMSLISDIVQGIFHQKCRLYVVLEYKGTMFKDLHLKVSELYDNSLIPLHFHYVTPEMIQNYPITQEYYKQIVIE